MYGYGYDTGEGLYGTGLYGLGYRYPKVIREAVYSRPDYLSKWAKAALFNTGLAKKNKWINFLKNETTAFNDISKILQQAATAYRAKYGISPSTKKGAKRRKEKLQTIVQAAPEYFDQLKGQYAEYGYTDYDAVKQQIINRINKEIKKLEDLEKFVPAQLPPPQ